MTIHTDDLLEKLDRVLAQPYLPPATRCGLCAEPLDSTQASLDFCSYLCQRTWGLERTNGFMRDEGRGAESASVCGRAECWCSHVSPDRIVTAVTTRHPQRLTVMQMLEEWLGLDPDS